MKVLTKKEAFIASTILGIFIPICFLLSPLWKPYVEIMTYSAYWGFAIPKTVAPFKLYLLLSSSVFIPLLVYQYLIISVIFKFVKPQKHFVGFISTGYGVYYNCQPNYLPSDENNEDKSSIGALVKQIIIGYFS